MQSSPKSFTYLPLMLILHINIAITKMKTLTLVHYNELKQEMVFKPASPAGPGALRDPTLHWAFQSVSSSVTAPAFLGIHDLGLWTSTSSYCVQCLSLWICWFSREYTEVVHFRPESHRSAILVLLREPYDADVTHYCCCLLGRVVSAGSIFVSAFCNRHILGEKLRTHVILLPSNP